MTNALSVANLYYSLSNGGVLKISKSAEETFCRYRQIGIGKKEGGGVILGRFIKNSKNIVIDIVTEPVFGDVRRKSYFFRSNLHQGIINKYWYESNGTINYLGEWHTHPENRPEPSSLDYKSWKKKLKNDIYPGEFLIFIIVGILELKIWEGCYLKGKWKFVEVKNGKYS